MDWTSWASFYSALRCAGDCGMEDGGERMQHGNADADGKKCSCVCASENRSTVDLATKQIIASTEIIINSFATMISNRHPSPSARAEPDRPPPSHPSILPLALCPKRRPPPCPIPHPCRPPPPPPDSPPLLIPTNERVGYGALGWPVSSS